MANRIPQSYYIEAVDAHELHGPFPTRREAHLYALGHFAAFRVIPEVLAHCIYHASSIRAVHHD